MILCLFAWHVKQVDDNEYDWGEPVGAMALIAAAVSSRPSSDPGFIFSYHSYRWSVHSLFQRQEHYTKPTQRLPPRRNVITQSNSQRPIGVQRPGLDTNKQRGSQLSCGMWLKLTPERSVTMGFGGYGRWCWDRFEWGWLQSWWNGSMGLVSLLLVLYTTA